MFYTSAENVNVLPRMIENCQHNVYDFSELFQLFLSRHIIGMQKNDTVQCFAGSPSVHICSVINKIRAKCLVVSHS